MSFESNEAGLRRRSVLDGGEPLFLSDDPYAETREGGEPKHGFALLVDFCENRDCRAAHLRAVDLQKGRDAPDGISDRELKRLVVIASLDLDTWDLIYPDETEQIPRDRELEPRFEALLERERANLKPILEKRWRFARGADRDAWRRADWSWWRSGQMVGWGEIHPDAPHFLFLSGGERFWAEDMYCVTPGCSCRDAAVCFRPVTDAETEPVAVVTVDLRRWTPSSVDDAGPLSARAERLWSDWNEAEPDLKKELGRRRKRMARLGRDIQKLARSGETPRRDAPKRGEKTAKVEAKVPRNAPCPCGSGRKYKKCCLGT